MFLLLSLFFSRWIIGWRHITQITAHHMKTYQKHVGHPGKPQDFLPMWKNPFTCVGFLQFDLSGCVLFFWCVVIRIEGCDVDRKVRESVRIHPGHSTGAKFFLLAKISVRNAFWEVLRWSWAVLEPSWGGLGSSWSGLGAVLERIGPTKSNKLNWFELIMKKGK